MEATASVQRIIQNSLGKQRMQQTTVLKLCCVPWLVLHIVNRAWKKSKNAKISSPSIWPNVINYFLFLTRWGIILSCGIWGWLEACVNFLSLTVFLSLYFWNQKCSEIPAIKCGSQIEAGALFTLFSRSWGLNRGNTINNEASKINFYKIPNY